MSYRLLNDLFADAEDKVQAWICRDCLGDWIIASQAMTLRERRTCCACEREVEKARDIQMIADRIQGELPKYFEVVPSAEEAVGFELAQVVGLSIDCGSEKANALIATLLVNPEASTEGFYRAGQRYRQTPAGTFAVLRDEVISEWQGFAHELIHGRRYFNQDVQNFFGSLVCEALRAKPHEGAEIPLVVKTLAAGSELFRARIARSKKELQEILENPGAQLSAPPKLSAANNRMSAAGMPLLYVSQTLETCVAEVRPSIGDTVVVGTFSPTRDMTIFDFTALEGEFHHEALSLFERGQQQRARHRHMLRLLHEELGRPLRAQDTDYVMTQALTEFIRYHKGVEFDGVAFRSVQNKEGINYVLFDSGDESRRKSPDWTPEFAVVLSEADVKVKTIQAVHYGLSDAQPSALTLTVQANE
ncbi:RES family NAD+ phosphorylase [Pseudomonas soli]|jgi:hypothetical protein|uniref:RES family NAD+ phosphorylase n=1 Tax=Pseudomonas soli TaxID=1306993 RepID=UPI003DA8D17D